MPQGATAGKHLPPGGQAGGDTAADRGQAPQGGCCDGDDGCDCKQWWRRAARLVQWEVPFRSLSGKFYTASGWTLAFHEERLERAYELDRAAKSVAMFYAVSAFAAVWISLLMVYYKLAGNWVGVDDGVYLVPLPAILYGVACAWVSRRRSRRSSPALLRVIEKAKLLALFFYCDVAITSLNMYIASQTHLGTAYLPWIPAISVGTAITVRRSIPATMLAYCFTFALDTVSVLTMHGMSFGAVLGSRWPVLLTTGLVMAIYAYQTEVAARNSFLNEREYESWKIAKEDLVMEKLVGSGTYGEVYRGTYHGFAVAIKKILAKPATLSSSVSANQNNQNNNNISVNQKGSKRSNSPNPSPTMQQQTLHIPHQQAHQKSGNSSFISHSTSAGQHNGATTLLSLFETMFRMLQNGRLSWRWSQREAEKLEQRKQDELFAEFELEIRAMLSLRHPNILIFMGACLEKPDMLLVTEFCDHGSLFDFLVEPSHKPILPAMKVEFCVGSASGLRYLHSLEPPMLHRDFKSLNILVDVNFNVKISDFGLCDFASELQARMSKREKDRRRKRTRSRSTSGKHQHGSPGGGSSSSHDKAKHRPVDVANVKVVGTIPWVAPEIFMQEPHSEQSDIYALGVVMWEIFAEKHPYMDELESGKLKVSDLVAAVVSRGYRPRIKKNLEPPTGKETPPAIIDLIRQCWDAKPAVRPDWDSIMAGLHLARTQQAASDSAAGNGGSYSTDGRSSSATRSRFSRSSTPLHPLDSLRTDASLHDSRPHRTASDMESHKVAALSAAQLPPPLPPTTMSTAAATANSPSLSRPKSAPFPDSLPTEEHGGGGAGAGAGDSADSDEQFSALVNGLTGGGGGSPFPATAINKTATHERRKIALVLNDETEKTKTRAMNGGGGGGGDGLYQSRRISMFRDVSADVRLADAAMAAMPASPLPPADNDAQ